MTTFDFIINIVEGILFSILTVRTFNILKKPYLLYTIIFAILFFVNISMCNYYNLSEAYCTFSNIIICVIFGYILTKKPLVQIIFISTLIYFCSFLANSLVIVISQTLFITYSLPLNSLIVISKIIFMLFVFVIPQYLKKIIYSEYINNWYFNIALIALLELYTLTFDTLFYQKGMNIKIYAEILCIIILTIAIYKVFQYVHFINQKKTEMQLNLKELSLNQKNYDFMKYSLESLARSQHEMFYLFNHIKILNHQENKIIDIFIDQQIEAINKRNKPIVSGNQTLDYVLYQYAYAFHNNNINLTYTKEDYSCPIPHHVYYTIMSKILDIAITGCQNKEYPQIYIQHGIIDNHFFTKVIFPLSIVNLEDIKHIEFTLKNYSHVLISENDINVYVLGFMIKD